MRNLSLGQVQLILILMLSSLIGLRIFDAIYLRQDMTKLETSWSEFQADYADRARLVAGFQEIMGYGGFIDNFSKYILRKDYEDYEAAFRNLGGVGTFIDIYLSLDTSPAEKNALQDLHRTIEQYGQSLRVIAGMVSVGATAREIEARFRIDDQLARRSLETLRALSPSPAKVTKMRLLANLQAALGYGGFIHGFRRYVLRGDYEDRALALQALAAVRRAIDAYRTQHLSIGETSALDDIAATLDAYERNFPKIESMMAEDQSPEAIDKAMNIDDTLALRALTTLGQEINLSLERYVRSMSFTFQRTARIERILYWSSMVLLCLGGALTFWTIRGLVVCPLTDLNTTMSRLADGDLDVEIEGTALRSEIGEMARSVQVFKHRTRALYETEQQLRTSQEELESQLASLQYLRDESEKQAAQAIGLAESLAAARDAAEKATARAEANESHIRTIVETTSEAIITADADGIIETFNSAAQVIFGWRAAEAIGQSASILMPAEVAATLDAYMKGTGLGNRGRIVGHVGEYEGLRRDGTVFPFELSINAMHIGGELKFTSIIRDITKRKRAEAEVQRLAMTDPLTGLANRNRFRDQFEDALALARRRPEWKLALLMFDLDDFKPVNDTFGHPVGDEVLKAVAAQLRRQTRESDTVARLGGDEFAALLVDSGGRDAVEPVVERIVEALKAPIPVPGYDDIRVGISIGVAFFPDDGASREDLIGRADRALYRAKAGGKNTWRFYDPSLEEKGG